MRMIQLPEPEQALPGRSQTMPVSEMHEVLGHCMQPPFPDGLRRILFGMGCFWGAEKKFWQVKGVYTTAVGYAAGVTPNPLYEEVCSGMTGHNEVVLVVYDPLIVALEDLLRVFWQGHNPTLGMRQGNDIGTQYRSGIYCFDAEQHLAAESSRDSYQEALNKECDGSLITTEIIPAPIFYYAEPYHQQYLVKNPGGYCPDITCYATGLPIFPS